MRGVQPLSSNPPRSPTGSSPACNATPPAAAGAAGAPYGYTVNPDTGLLEVEPRNAALVATILDLYSRQRPGAQTVANRLNQRGPRGVP